MTAILFFLIVVSFGALAAFRLLTPDAYVRVKRRPRFSFPWSRPHLLPDAPAGEGAEANEGLPEAIDLPLKQEEMPASIEDKLNKVEALLLEKNKLIDRLSRELEAERSHRKSFDNVKAVMDDEIRRLREELRELKVQKQEKSHA